MARARASYYFSSESEQNVRRLKSETRWRPAPAPGKRSSTVHIHHFTGRGRLENKSYWNIEHVFPYCYINTISKSFRYENVFEFVCNIPHVVKMTMQSRCSICTHREGKRRFKKIIVLVSSPLYYYYYTVDWPIKNKKKYFFPPKKKKIDDFAECCEYCLSANHSDNDFRVFFSCDDCAPVLFKRGGTQRYFFAQAHKYKYEN